MTTQRGEIPAPQERSPQRRGQRDHSLSTARPVDAVVNAQLPPTPKSDPQSGEPTGINYIELLQTEKEDGDV